MEDKMVELTRFVKVSEAELLASLLRSEGVDCYVRDGYMNQIYDGLDLGGVKVELLQKDMKRAMEIMSDHGYTSSNDNSEIDIVGELDDSDDLDHAEISEEEMAKYMQKKAKMSRNLTIIMVLIIFLTVILILLNKYYKG